MSLKVLVSLLVLYISSTNGAPHPEPVDGSHQVYDYHFNQMGVHFGLKLDDKSMPVKGGKIFAEFPVHTIFKLIEGEPTLFKKMFIPFKEELYLFYTPSMLERLRDVLTVKAVITYKGEDYKSGVFDTKMEYTFIHPDYTEETGTFHVEGKSGQAIAMEVVSKNDVVLPKFVLKPFKIEASFRPNTEFKVVYTGTYGTIDMTLSRVGQTFKVHTVYKHPEHEHTYDFKINVAEKTMKVAHTENGEEMTNLDFVLKGKMMNLKMMNMKGNVEATRWFEAGPIESTFMVKGKNYDFNMAHNNKEIMKTKINVQNLKLTAKMNLDFMDKFKGTVYIDYDTAKKVFEITFPKEWFADNKKFGLTITLKPTNVDHPFFGGVYSASMMREDVPFLNFDCDFKFTMDAAKYELVFNHVRVESLDANLVNGLFDMLPITKYEFCHMYLINGCFQKGEFAGKIFFDRVNKNDIFNKFTIKGTVTKMEKEVFSVIFDTVSTPYHFSVFYPHVFQRMFNKPIERFNLDVLHEVSGTDHSLTLTTNYEDMTLKFERKPGHISANILKQEVSYVEFVQEHELVDNNNNFLFTMKPTLHFHTASYIHKELCEFSSYTCFTELKSDVHIEIFDKAARMVDVKVTVHKDTSEVYHLEATNKQTPYKFVFKSPYVVPLYNYMKGQTWFTWMMPVNTMSPFDIIVKFNPADKSMLLKTNIDTHENQLEVVPLGGGKFNVEFDHEVVAEFVAADKKVEVTRTMKDGTQLKTLVTWTRGDLVENTATATVMYRGVGQVATIGWNVRDLAHGTVKIDLMGKKAPFVGDFEFHRNIKWNIINGFELVWDGKTTSNLMETIATPVVTDAKITYNNRDVQVKIEEKFNAKTYTLMFNTKPFKFALLPFFEV